MTYSRLQFMVGEQYAPGDFIPLTLKAQYRARMPSMESPGETVAVSTNALGLRGAETTLEKPPGTRRILVLGDSYTFGVYCGDEDTYPAVLQRLYSEHGQRVEVLNAGYADGWSPEVLAPMKAQAGWHFFPRNGEVHMNTRGNAFTAAVLKQHLDGLAGQ